MNKSLFLILFFIGLLLCESQELVTKKFNLSSELNENSGLLFFNGTLITHNDSGGQPILYQLNTVTGAIERRVKISNAFNIDWEDLAQDEEYIYISDSGNNRGNRTNLKIYKVSKKDFLDNNTVVAKTIFYKYDNQKNYVRSSKTNFDAEALISFEDKLLIFSKNRGNNKTNIYQLDKKPGTQTAKYLYTLDIDGQVTGGTKNKKNEVVLSGYTSSLSPFMLVLKDFDLKSRSFTRLDFSQFLGVANQVEGITFVNDSVLNFSRERFKKKIAGFSINKPATVFEFNLNDLINVISETSNKEDFDSNLITRITDEKGKTILKKKDTINSSKIKKLPSGIYYSKIKFNDQITTNKKIIID